MSARAFSRQHFGLGAGPLLALVAWVWLLPDLPPAARQVGAITLWMVAWWLTEAVPLAVTAVAGAVALAGLQVLPLPVVLRAGADPILLLIIGSFLLARALQRHQVDRHLAALLLDHPWVAGSAHRLLWAIATVAWALAMWVGITACVAALYPVVVAMARHRHGPTGPAPAAWLLLLVYGASAGAMATPIGTPPNLIGLGLIRELLGRDISFLAWMAFGLPLSLLLLASRVGLVAFLAGKQLRLLPSAAAVVAAPLPRWTPPQRVTLGVFAAAIVGWIGFSRWVAPGMVALAAAGILSLWRAAGQREPLLPLREAVHIDWATVCLFGGGLVLGRAMVDTGLAAIVGRTLLGAFGVPAPLVLIAAAVLLGTALSEICSNTVAANLVVPTVMGLSASTAAAVPVMLGATLGASLGFMLPVSTPANAMIYGSGQVRLAEMVWWGAWMDVTGGVIVWGVVAWWLPRVLGP